LSPVYSSPKSGTAAAATAPARLAREFREPTLWRTAPDGTTDVVTLQGSVLRRYRVNDDGTAELLDSSDCPRRWGWVALATGGLLFVGGGLASEAVEQMAVVVVLGWPLWILGMVLLGRSGDLASRAHRAYGGKGQWHAPTDLREWTPRSSAQLAAVEEIAEDHGGVAFVSDVGARTVDVVAVKTGRLERYWVDEAGRAELAGSSGSRGPYVAHLLVMSTAMLIFFALLAVIFAVEEHKILLILVLVPALGAALVFGWSVDPDARVERRLKRGSDGRQWIDIRTREPDGGE
jgi:hypothetical protein